MTDRPIRRLTFAVVLAAVIFTGCRQNRHADWTEAEKKIIEGNASDGSGILHVYTVADSSEAALLRATCSELTPQMLNSGTYRALAEKMLATVTSPEQDGVGIAGPQVGISRRIVAVLRYDKLEAEGAGVDNDPRAGFEVYPNIRITQFNGDMAAGPEGCLSVPDRRGDVARYRDIVISYTSPATLRDTTERVCGYTAVIFQHECDHLDGVLYTDKLIQYQSRILSSTP